MSADAEAIRAALDAAVALDNEWWNGEHSDALAALDRLVAAHAEAEQKLAAASTMLAEAEKIVPGVITTAGRFAIGLNDRERAQAAEARLRETQEALREVVQAAILDGGSRAHDAILRHSVAAEFSGSRSPVVLLPEEPGEQEAKSAETADVRGWEPKPCGAPKAQRACETETPTKACWCRRGYSPHSELCAWRFGANAECDCESASVPVPVVPPDKDAQSAKSADVRGGEQA